MGEIIDFKEALEKQAKEKFKEIEEYQSRYFDQLSLFDEEEGMSTAIPL